MQYKNTKTGVVIDTPCVVSGGNWVPFNSEFVKELEIEQKPIDDEKSEETPDHEVKSEEPEENLADFDGITRKQIMQELDAFGIEYDKRANKQTLYDLMMSQGK